SVVSSTWIGRTAAGQDGPRSASSASRHSTSSRSVPPPEKMRFTIPAGGSVSENSTASRLSTASLPAGLTLRPLPHFTRSKRRAAASEFGLCPLRGEPVEAAQRYHQALFLRTPHDVGHFDERILQVGGHDFEVVPVKGDELHRLHDARSLPSKSSMSGR